jgi:gamma-glutamylcyclotransferase (GGCT)/AIG2-like uncharacterized protein YtfP
MEAAAPLPPFILGISHLQTPVMLYPNATAHGAIYLEISPSTLNRLEELRSKQTDSRHMYLRSALTLTYAEQTSGKYYWESYEVKTKGFNCIRIPEPDWLDLLRALEFKRVRIYEIPEDIAKAVDAYAAGKGITPVDAVEDAISGMMKKEEQGHDN